MEGAVHLPEIAGGSTHSGISEESHIGDMFERVLPGSVRSGAGGCQRLLLIVKPFAIELQLLLGRQHQISSRASNNRRHLMQLQSGEQ